MEQPIVSPDEKGQIQIEENMQIKYAHAFVTDTKKQTAMYATPDARGRSVYTHYGVFENTTENVFFVQGIESTIY